MEELTALDLILKYAGEFGLGPIATIIGAMTVLWNRYSKQREAEHQAEIAIRMDEVKAREKENELRRMGLRMDRAVLEFLKGAGYEVEVPDITRDII